MSSEGFHRTMVNVFQADLLRKHSGVERRGTPGVAVKFEIGMFSHSFGVEQFFSPKMVM